MNEQLDIFRQHNLRGLVHKHGLVTEVQSALAVAPHLNAIQAAVLAAFLSQGPMTAEQLERLPQFASYAPSTIRKRLSELQQRGDLVATGTVKNSRGRRMTVWRAT